MSGTTITIPELTTDRLRLRAPMPSDLEAYADFRGSPRSVGVGGPYPRETAFQQFCALVGHWHVRGYGRWIVADRQTDAPLGIVGPFFPADWPEPEIAWSLFDNAEGRGIAQEAARAALAHAFGPLGWSTAISLVKEDNPRSQALAERLGARRDGVFAHPSLGPLTIWRHSPAAPEPR